MYWDVGWDTNGRFKGEQKTGPKEKCRNRCTPGGHRHRRKHSCCLRGALQMLHRYHLLWPCKEMTRRLRSLERLTVMLRTIQRGSGRLRGPRSTWLKMPSLSPHPLGDGYLQGTTESTDLQGGTKKDRMVAENTYSIFLCRG